MATSSIVVYSVVGQTGAVAAQPAVSCTQSSPRTHEPIQVTISAGTATVVISGRVSANSAWVVLSTLSASDIVLVPTGLQLSVSLSAAAGATVLVESQLPMALV